MIKYKKLEEDTGRSDNSEGTLTFAENEIQLFPEKLPKASFNGVEFHCASVAPDDQYLQQYFVFCMCVQSDASPIGDCRYAAELDTDIFEMIELLLPTPGGNQNASDGAKFFSHGRVEYFDIHNHPAPIRGDRWREVYKKHSKFSQQNEYRAVLFASDHFFERTRKTPMLAKRNIYDANNCKMDFDLKLRVRSSIDNAGWRYVEFDISEFQANLLREPCPVLTLGS
ncbi:hypothetical protein [Hyphomicrobium sp.]|uniref:hypothetical protein n=1 Tax=Hyphomicrobium sp. TaxID=82 RepID=UPI002E3572DC|nr:hypothetical protein [Hyphomicrobium sp.]HEX2840323.1 hypothetical protein [Hyphomicrobium sp.]